MHLNPGGGGCNEPRLCHCTPAWATRAKLCLKKKKKDNPHTFTSFFRFLSLKRAVCHVKLLLYKCIFSLVNLFFYTSLSHEPKMSEEKTIFLPNTSILQNLFQKIKERGAGHFGGLRGVDYLRSGVQDQPDQYGETLSLLKNTKN